MKYLLILLLVVCGCNDNTLPIDGSEKTLQYSSGLKILSIDSCEYVLYQGPNNGDFAMVHSGNCHNPKHQTLK